MTRTVTIGGFMGVGKTTVGRLLADRLGARFVDLDEAVESSCGQTVAEIFEAQGEEAFRALEHSELVRLLDGPPVVLALGGGTLHQPGAADMVLSRSDLIVLWADFSIIRRRVGLTDDRRPRWSDAEALFQSRAAGYLSFDQVINVGNMTTGQVVEQVVGVIQCG